MAIVYTDDFSVDTLANGTWTVQQGVIGSWSISGGVLSEVNGAASTIMYSSYQAADSEIIWKLTTGSSVAFGTLGSLISRVISSGNTQLMGSISGTSNQIQIHTRIAGTSTLRASSAFTPSTATNYWVKMRTEGANVTVTVYGADPRTGSPSALASVTWAITSGLAVQSGVVGGVGFRNNGTGGATNGTRDDFTIDDLGSPVPANTAAPTISGSAIVGQTLTSTTGSWSNTPTSYQYKWQRDGVDIVGATASTYTTVTGDVGTVVTSMVAGTNAAGSGPYTSSASGLVIVPAWVVGDMKWYRGGASGLGGSLSAEITSPSAIWDAVTNAEATAGDVEYRLIYLKNTHSVTSATLAGVWVASQTTSPTTSIDIGLATQAVGTDAPAIATESTVPPGVTFTAPSTSGTALSIGTLGPGQHKGIWLRRTVLTGTVPAASDTCQLGHIETAV